MQTDFKVIIAIAAAVLLGVIIYYIARFLKGRLTLELSSPVVDSKQPISGSLTVQAKKNINGLLIIALVGRMKETVRTAKGSSSKWVDVFRQESVLEEQRDFPAGYFHQYPFTFTAPTASEARSGRAILRQAANQVGGAVGSAIQVAAGIVGMRQGRIVWHVEARLDAEGVDLYTKQKLTVNLKD